MKTRQALTNETAKRYRTAGRKGKTKILDEFVDNTGYCRKYALHILANGDTMRFVEVDGKPVKLKTGKTRPKSAKNGRGNRFTCRRILRRSKPPGISSGGPAASAWRPF
jgi:hypothetical protein